MPAAASGNPLYLLYNYYGLGSANASDLQAEVQASNAYGGGVLNLPESMFNGTSFVKLRDPDRSVVMEHPLTYYNGYLAHTLENALNAQPNVLCPQSLCPTTSWPGIITGTVIGSVLFGIVLAWIIYWCRRKFFKKEGEISEIKSSMLPESK